MRRRISLICAAAVLAFGLSACGSDDDLGDSTTVDLSSDASKAESETKSDSSFKDGVLTTPDMKIEVTDHKIIPVGQKGNEYGDKPVLAIWYKTTNLSGEDIDPSDFIFAFGAVQDNNPNSINELEVGMLPDERFLDSQMEKIKKGGTVGSAIAYELDDLTTPVDLIASDGIAGDELGRMTFKLK